MVSGAIGKSARRGGWFYAALAAWAAVVVIYLGWLTAYSFAPGGLATPPRLQAVALPRARDADSHLLVMAVHPKCPCSRASVGELGRLLARSRDRLECVVLVYRPHEQRGSWSDTDLVETTRLQPHTQIADDTDGQLARQLGMTTSGSVVLYSPQGEPEFWGGITMARGHAGDNIGSDAILAIVSGAEPARRTAPVFGCRIHADTIAASK
jgi:hypothetical protein